MIVIVIIVFILSVIANWIIVNHYKDIADTVVPCFTVDWAIAIVGLFFIYVVKGINL